MSAIIELIGHFIVDIFLVSTGGFILWIYEGRKKPIKTYINPDFDRSHVVGIAFWISVAVVIALYYYFTNPNLN